MDFAVAHASACPNTQMRFSPLISTVRISSSTTTPPSEESPTTTRACWRWPMPRCCSSAIKKQKKASRLIRHSGHQLRVVACRNTGWQALLRDRYAAAASCFSRMAEDDGATWTQQVEGLIGLALVHHQLGQQDASDDALRAAREAADGRSDRGWLATIDLIIYEFAVQAGIRCSNRLLEHAFWQSAEMGATLLANHGGRNGWTPTVSQGVPMPALIQRRAEYLSLLRRMADGDRAAIDPLMATLNHSRKLRPPSPHL
uniref:Regulatory protein HrpB n=1 Tax=Ralstonia solanacearum TaxID=305 RepID=U3U993_RALSL|nr:regulatory protein HrpB [Ralstonia solanacearum]